MNTIQEFHEFYNDIFNKVYRYAYVIMKREAAAEDVAQETFFIAYEKWEEVKGHPNPEGWLYKTAYNIITNYDRRFENHAMSLEELETEFVNAHAWEGFREVDMRLTMDRLLDEDEQKLIMMHYYGGYSIAEIAKYMDVTEGTLRVRFCRIRKKMKGQFE